MRFKEKVALVTGAGQGIGRAVAERFVEEGAIVVMNDINGERVRQVSAAIAGSGEAIPMVADVTQVDQVHGMVDQVVASYGRIDILVNNVGGLEGGGIEEASLEYWHRMMDWNLTSQFICCKAVVPLMKEQRYGRIVNVSSTAALRGGTALGEIVYPTAKAGVVGFTKELARYVGPYGITVNVVVPYDVMTETNIQAIEDMEEYLAHHAAHTPLGRPGEPREIANCIAFLASDDASYVTGAALLVTGGLLM